MQGVKNLILGLILLASGGGAMMGVDLGRGILAWGAWGLIALGAVLVAGGVYQAVGPGSGGADAQEAYKTSSTARLLMQSMLATALADGHLDDEEVETIAEACELVVHEHLDPDSIRRLAALVEEKGEAIMEEIRHEGQMLNRDARKAIIDACVLVLTAADDIDARKTAAVNAIARQLDFSEIESQTMIAEAVSAEKN